VNLQGAEVLLGVTGSIAAYKAAELASQLKKKGSQLTVVMTPSARSFVGPITFVTLSQRPVVVDLFSETERWDPEHVAMAQRAQLFVVAPATANILAKLACGLADDAVSTTALAVTCPLVVAPAMNDRMWAHPTVQRNLRTLQERGARVVPPAHGVLACGSVGIGKMASVEEVLQVLETL
jgi:phosphopantothenoylcysteine synthetase/decarboxylase